MKTISILLIILTSTLVWAGIDIGPGASGAPRINTSATDLPANFTWSLWVALTRLPSNEQDAFPLIIRETHLSFSPGTPTCRQFFLYYDTNKHIAVDRAFTGSPFITSTFTLADFKYHHIVVTRSSTAGGTWTLYVDGTLDTTVLNASTQDSGCFFSINLRGTGFDSPSCGNTFFPRHCFFAEVAAWPQVLPTQLIKALANGVSPSLLGLPMLYYWPFYGDPSAVQSHFGDQSGNGWNATTFSPPGYANHCPGCSIPTGENH